MIELTLENREKFFALYYGQEVWLRKDNQLFIMDGESIETPYGIGILLKPLSSITDEDAVEMARIALYHPTIEGFCNDDVWIGEGDLDNIGNHSLEVGMRCWEGTLTINDQTGIVKLSDEDKDEQFVFNTSKLVDYLRSKGYALPWMGLSVEEMVEAGWIKLKEV